MIKIMVIFFVLLLGIVSWFFSFKATEAFSVLVPPQEKIKLQRFCTRNGRIFFIFALLMIFSLFFEDPLFMAISLVIVSLYTAGFAWQLAALLKH